MKTGVQAWGPWASIVQGVPSPLLTVQLMPRLLQVERQVTSQHLLDLTLGHHLATCLNSA